MQNSTETTSPSSVGWENSLPNKADLEFVLIDKLSEMHKSARNDSMLDYEGRHHMQYITNFCNLNYNKKLLASELTELEI